MSKLSADDFSNFPTPLTFTMINLQGGGEIEAIKKQEDFVDFEDLTDL